MSIGRFRKPQTRASVNVAASLTTLAGPFDTTGHSVLNVEIQNPGPDILDAQLEVATDSAGPFAVIPWDGLKGIASGDTRNESYSKVAKTWMRVRGLSLGSPIGNVIVSFHMETP